MGYDTRRFFVSAYATSPSFHNWQPQLESRYFSALASSPDVAGLEHPFFDDSDQQYPIPWLAANLPPQWMLALTVLPGLMRNARNDPDFGLASQRESSRAAAVRMMERVREHVEHLERDVGRRVVRALHIHTSPSQSFENLRGSRDAFAVSLKEILALGWPDISLSIEHCDSPVANQPVEKGFLRLEDEIDLAAEAGLGIVLNWGRSAIETRSAEGPVRHLRQVRVAGLLRGFFFSGCASRSTLDYGVWRDTHMPAAPVIASPYLRKESLLDESALSGCLMELRMNSTDVYLGVKVLDPNPDGDLKRKIGLNLDTIAAVASMDEAQRSINPQRSRLR
jgi:hypothetical protein